VHSVLEHLARALAVAGHHRATGGEALPELVRDDATGLRTRAERAQRDVRGGEHARRVGIRLTAGEFHALEVVVSRERPRALVLDPVADHVHDERGQRGGA
jgi:hypothetical protein